MNENFWKRVLLQYWEFYQVRLLELIKAAFKARKVEYNNDRNDIIEVAEEAKKEIESIVSYKSMFYIKNIKIAANRRGLSFLKIKSLGK